MTDETTPEVTATPTDTTPPAVWPNQPPVRTHIYGFIDPAWNVQMCAMTLETWQDIIQDMKTLKARLDQLTAENIEFKQGRKPEGEGGRILTLDKLRNH